MGVSEKDGNEVADCDWMSGLSIIRGFMSHGACRISNINLANKYVEDRGGVALSMSAKPKPTTTVDMYM